MSKFNCSWTGPVSEKTSRPDGQIVTNWLKNPSSKDSDVLVSEHSRQYKYMTINVYSLHKKLEAYYRRRLSSGSSQQELELQLGELIIKAGVRWWCHSRQKPKLVSRVLPSIFSFFRQSPSTSAGALNGQSSRCVATDSAHIHTRSVGFDDSCVCD